MLDAMLELVRPDSPELWRVARALVEEYAAQLNVDLAFQDFQHEIEGLAREYGAPDGCFLLARQSAAFVGCGGVRRFSESACEMKRLYVVPAMRGGRVGRAITDALVNHAREAGYQTMLLDTLPSMTSAQGLYRALGYLPTSAYRYNPVPGASFLSLTLR